MNTEDKKMLNTVDKYINDAMEALKQAVVTILEKEGEIIELKERVQELEHEIENRDSYI